MCGITGWIRNDGVAVDRNLLTQMTDSLRHRGPDDGGVTGGGEGAVRWGLGHRRLSIIDLSAAGHQPMALPDNSLWVSFNGEIYNFRTLREELEKSGSVFISNSDTEVLLHGFRAWGTMLFDRLIGMFAFALWDDRSKELFLVRDRFGQKPLYFTDGPSGLLFASELKALLANPSVERKIDLQNLGRYLAFEYLPAPYSIIRGINKLQPGHFLKWQNGERTDHCYWQPQYRDDNRWAGAGETEIAARLRELLLKSIERRLISDVPLGVFLSGGIDSSSIVSLMSEIVEARRIKTFSISFNDGSFDESSWSSLVAKTYGTEHFDQLFTANKMLDILPEIWQQLDEPFADASVLPTYLLSRFTREQVTVALGGDGSDELFAGYDPFLAHRLAASYHAVPRFLRTGLIEPLISRLPVSTANMSLDFRLKQFVSGMDYPAVVRNQVWLGSFPPAAQRTIFSDEIRGQLSGFDVYEHLVDENVGITYRDDWDRLIHAYTRDYLAEDILTKVDRASMAVSLEVRAPFLDAEFAAFANSLPAKWKVRGLTRKYILKNAMRDKLPDQIIKRPKKGFGIPVAKWLKTGLKAELDSVFSQSRIREGGIFNHREIQLLLDDHQSGRKDNRKQLWTLLMFEKWREHYRASW
jgi:asparagine synthase (glutamine-hydrolysing)